MIRCREDSDSWMAKLPGDVYLRYVTCSAFWCVMCEWHVIERTVIVNPPSPQVISAPSDITVTCQATTAPSEAHRLRIQWRRNGDVINPAKGSRYVISDDGSQLTIRQSRVTDTATYTCRAENGVDFDTVEVPITVRGSMTSARQACRAELWCSDFNRWK